MSARRINIGVDSPCPHCGLLVRHIIEGAGVGRIRDYDELRKTLDVAFTLRRHPEDIVLPRSDVAA